MYRGIDAIPVQSFTDQDRVLEVVTAPGHKSHRYVLTERQFALFRGGPVGNNLTGLHPLALFNDRPVVETGVLVGTDEFL